MTKFQYMAQFRKLLANLGWSKAGADKLVRRIQKYSNNHPYLKEMIKSDCYFYKYLSCTFTWDESPQGFNHWYHIYRVLEEYEVGCDKQQ